jgi:signal transduction histidine kinase
MNPGAGSSRAGVPASTEAASPMWPTLGHSPLLQNCTDVQLDDLRARSSEVVLGPGELLFDENDVADAVWVVAEGELVITKMVDGDETIVDHLVPGAFLGEISLLTDSPAGHRARAKDTVRLLRIPKPVFSDLVRSCQAVSVTVLRTMAERVRRIAHLLQQRERMAGLGTMAAGLAHELNNPAAAAKRAAALLKEQVAALEPLAQGLASRSWSPAEVALLRQLDAVTGRGDQSTRELDALARSDREDDVGRWLDAHGVARAWELASVLVDRGVNVEMLGSVMQGCDPSAVSDALEWAERMGAIRQMLDEVEGSTTRIAQIVKAVKAYSYADTSSLRSADIHEALDISLTILGHKLRDVGATVERKYDRTLPAIQTYGTELGQVWTNLLDNAADAIAAGDAKAGARGGQISVRTTGDQGGIRVEIADSGRGIPADVLPRIFDPFFTTKGAGKGTGLGLEIAKRIVTRHGGTIDATSSPGATTFTVWLPVRQSAAGGGVRDGASQPATDASPVAMT